MRPAVRHIRPHLTTALAALGSALVVTGCVGTVDDAQGVAVAPAPPASPPTAGEQPPVLPGRGPDAAVAPGAGTTGGPPPPAACAPPPTRIWRLSETQFANAIADLLPGVKVDPPEAIGTSADAFLNAADGPPVGSAAAGSFQRVARDAATRVAADVATHAPCGATEDRRACAQRFVDQIAPRAFRRPLDAAERDGLVAVFETSARLGYAAGIGALVEAIFQAPSFVYRTELGATAGAGQTVTLTAFELASALSFFLLDSVPDLDLWRAASDGSLRQRDVLEQQVRRLSALPRVRKNVTHIFLRWIDAPAVLRAERDPKQYPEFDAALRGSLYAELERFVGDRLWNGGTLADLMTSRRTVVDARLAKLYGTPAPSGNGVAQAQLPGDQRGGLMTLAGFIAAIPPGDRIVHRGKAVRFGLLCGSVPPPPAGLDTSPPPGQKLTERQYAAQRAANPACGGCHAHMDPLGLALEHYDDIGRFVTMRDGAPVDASGILQRTDVDGPFVNAVDLSERLGRSAVLRSCLVERLITYALGRALADSDRCAHQRVVGQLEAAGTKLSDAVAGVATAALFDQRLARE